MSLRVVIQKVPPHEVQARFDGFREPMDAEAYRLLVAREGRWTSRQQVCNLMGNSRSKACRQLNTLWRNGVILKGKIVGKPYPVYKVVL